VRSFFGGLPPEILNPDKAEIRNNIEIPNSKSQISNLCFGPLVLEFEIYLSFGAWYLGFNYKLAFSKCLYLIKEK
jgi:hypothetical protein